MDMTSRDLRSDADAVLVERIRTDCLWPSFAQVELVAFPMGAGTRISDDAGAARSAWMHGCDDQSAAEAIATAALRFGLKVEGGAIYADVEEDEWRRSAELAVANASAQAAYGALAAQPPVQQSSDLLPG